MHSQGWSKNKDNRFPVVVVEDPSALESLNMRSSEPGLTLLVLRDLDGRRQLGYVMGSVGRFDDECTRIGVET